MPLIYEISDKSRFHPVPGIPTPSCGEDPTIWDSHKISQCSRETGHVLKVKGNTIYCERCPASWKDEGF